MPPLLATRNSSKISRGSANVNPCGRSRARGNVLDDPPVLPRLARALNRLVDLDDAALDLRDQAFVLLLQAARQYHVGMARGVVQEEIDRA